MNNNIDMGVAGLKSSIEQFISLQVVNLHGTVLDVGCGDMPYKELIFAKAQNVEKYIGLDLDTNHISRQVIPDLSWDGVHIPLPDQSVEHVIATEVLEHCPDPEKVLREINRVLKGHGSFLFTTPFLWPLHEVPGDYQRFTPFLLKELLTKSGFNSAHIEMLGGWDASLAQMIGLWLARRPGLHPRKKQVLSYCLRPVVNYLYKKDFKPEKFEESQMVTGLCGVAEK